MLLNSKMLRYECQRYILYINFKNLTCLNVTANCPTQLMSMPGDTAQLRCQHGELSSEPHAKLSVCSSRHLWPQHCESRRETQLLKLTGSQDSLVSELWVQWRDTAGNKRGRLRVLTSGFMYVHTHTAPVSRDRLLQCLRGINANFR